MAHDRAHSSTRQRVVTSLLAPVLFLLFSELALRWIGFGGGYPLFVPADEMAGYLHANSEVLRRYFPTRSPKIGPERIEFLQDKGPETSNGTGRHTASGAPDSTTPSYASM